MRSGWWIALLSIVGVVGLATKAMAEVVVHERAGVQIWIPDDWDAHAEGDELTISGPDDDDPDVVIYFEILKAREVKAALDEVDDALDEACDDIKVQEGEALTINGLDALAVTGTGMVEGEKVELGVMIVETASSKILLVAAIATTADFDTHKATIHKVLRSIAPQE